MFILLFFCILPSLFEIVDLILWFWFSKSLTQSIWSWVISLIYFFILLFSCLISLTSFKPYLYNLLCLSTLLSTLSTCCRNFSCLMRLGDFRCWPLFGEWFLRFFGVFDFTLVPFFVFLWLLLLLDLWGEVFLWL